MYTVKEQAKDWVASKYSIVDRKLTFSNKRDILYQNNKNKTNSFIKQQHFIS
jgi:hypothetical protein